MKPFGKIPEHRWPIRVEPLEDEITSSWLVRTARAYGETPNDFAQLAWGDLPVWNRDVDNTVSAVALRALGRRLDIDPVRAAETSLRAFLSRLGAINPAWAPGLLRAGIYHRIRRRHGQQYCPSCLAGDPVPYFRRRWRLAFAFVCESHHCLLRDACPDCDAPVVAHRSRELALDRCCVCDQSLAGSPTPASAFQTAAQQVLSTAWEMGVAEIDTRTLPFPEWLRGLRILYHALHRPGIAAWILSTEKVDQVPHKDRAAPLEIARLRDRALLLPAAVWLTCAWPRHMLDVGRELELRATEILDPKRSPAPAWLLQVVKDNFPYVPRARRHKRRKPGGGRIAAHAARQRLNLGQALTHRLDAVDSQPGGSS